MPFDAVTLPCSTARCWPAPPFFPTCGAARSRRSPPFFLWWRTGLVERGAGVPAGWGWWTARWTSRMPLGGQGGGGPFRGGVGVGRRLASRCGLLGWPARFRAGSEPSRRGGGSRRGRPGFARGAGCRNSIRRRRAPPRAVTEGQDCAGQDGVVPVVGERNTVTGSEGSRGRGRPHASTWQGVWPLFGPWGVRHIPAEPAGTGCGWCAAALGHRRCRAV